MKEYKTEQEKFWSSEFGDDYTKRNNNSEIIASNINFFAKIFQNIKEIKSVIEFGANVGKNLVAIKYLLPNIKISAIEINKQACEELKKYDWLTIYNQSILEFDTNEVYDLVFTKGVLIHMDPNELDTTYEKLIKATKKYLLIAEYYNPVPVQVSYRGHSDKLFKRDFAGELLSRYDDLKLLTYGFTYHLDNNFPQDDVTWFLMERIHKNT